MHIKICGLTLRRDAAVAAELGATHLGCVIAPGTRRSVSARQAGAILAGLGAVSVLVCRDLSLADIVGAIDATGITTVQLHRYPEETAARLEQDGVVVHRAVEVDGSLPAVEANTERIVHLDVGGGGSGRSFDWRVLAPVAPSFTFVAGGITPENVSELLAYDPWGIDVSSGIESSFGHKDHDRMAALIAAARHRRAGRNVS